MRFSISTVKQAIAVMVAVAIVATALSAGPLGAVGAQDDGVDVPPPSNDGDTPDPYDCGDFENYDQVRAVFLDEFPDDTSDLDGDDDGVPCETEFPDAAETVTPTEDTDTTTETTTTTTTTTTEETTTEETTTTTETTTEETTTETETETTTEETTTEEATTEEETDDGAADGGNGKAKIGGDDGDDTADGGNGKAKED